MATIPDELLEEIFLGPPMTDALARVSAAATTNASFRRVIKGRAFRRRFRALHRPPLLGFIDVAGFHPAQAPHPSASLAPCAADFSFVPAVVSSSCCYITPDVQDRCLHNQQGPRWRPRDVRDGRVLLDWISLHPGGELANQEQDRCCNVADFHLAVCDPLFRRYMLLPTIPEDLAAQPQDLLWEFEPLLAPNTGDDDNDEPFKVICIARYQTKLVLFIFPSATSRWSMVESPVFPTIDHMSCFDCVRGCIYWTEPWGWSDQLMVLDMRTMSFSTVNLLTGYHKELRDLPHQSLGHRRQNAVVMGREGAIEVVSLVHRRGSFALHHTSLQNNSHEWKLEKIIQLPGQYREYSISTVGAAEGFLFFRGTPQGIHPIENNVSCYSMEVKTYEITKVCTKSESFLNRKRAIPYFSFPPVLSEPTI